MIFGPNPSDFLWATGIEDTFVPQTRPGHRSLDEYELMGHYEHWREDLALACDLGVQALRWGVPWYRVEPQPGTFDWCWTDEVIPYIVQELGITPIIDLMHYGCPLWMRQPFIDSSYPQAVATYAAAFADRYKHLVRWYTPLNEPIINTVMCGQRGLWPPYLRGDRGYARIMVQIAKGILHTVKAIRAIDPKAIMVHVEASGLVRAGRDDLQSVVIEDQHRLYLCYDLLTGKVRPDHLLFPWLVRNGISPDELAAIKEQAIGIDVMGINFYPQWSTKQAYINRRGHLAYRAIEKDGAGLATLISDHYQRYNAPIMITETSTFGSVAMRSRWLQSSLAAVKQLRSKGVPVVGYTWFPLFTMIDWRYRYGRRSLDDYRIELGLYRLSDTGAARWHATPLVDQFRSYTSDPEAAIGTLANV